MSAAKLQARKARLKRKTENAKIVSLTIFAFFTYYITAI